MAKNEFTNEWFIGYIAQLKAKYRMKPAEDIPDPGPESNLQAKVQAYCKENGWPCFHDRSKKVNEPGWPDCFIFIPGKVILIELKSSAGKLRKEQYALRRELGWNNHMVYIAKSFKRVVEIIEWEKEGKGSYDNNNEKT